MSNPERLDRVYAWCDLLHSKMDTWKNAFRPQTDAKDLSNWHRKKRKEDTEEDNYESRRIKEIMEKYTRK